MNKKYMEKATREGRVALLPEFLQVGREVWYWRESLCDEDGCPDMVTVACPLNAGAFFTPRGVEWVINELPAVPDWHLRNAFFTTRAEALRNRPGRIV